MGSPLVLLRFCSAERRNKTLEPCQFCLAPVFWLWQTAGSCSVQGVGHTGKNPHDVFSVAHWFSLEDFFSLVPHTETQLFGKRPVCSNCLEKNPRWWNISLPNTILGAAMLFFLNAAESKSWRPKLERSKPHSLALASELWICESLSSAKVILYKAKRNYTSVFTGLWFSEFWVLIIILFLICRTTLQWRGKAPTQQI